MAVVAIVVVAVILVFIVPLYRTQVVVCAGVAIILLPILNGLKNVWQRCRRWMAARWLAILAVAAVALILLCIVPLIGTYIWDTTTPGWKFWLETLSGNWSPDNFPPLSNSKAGGTPVLSVADRYQYSFAAGLAVLLNNAAIILIVGLVWRLISEVRSAMNLRQAFVTKDQMIQQALLDEFSDDAATMEKIERAFRIGEARWKPHAEAIFGKKAATEFFARHVTR